MRQPAGKPAVFAPPEAAHDAMPDERMQPGIAGQDLEFRPGGRITVEYDGDIFAEALEHGTILPFPRKSLKYCPIGSNGQP
jgi:hypothetical protein